MTRLEAPSQTLSARLDWLERVVPVTVVVAVLIYEIAFDLIYRDDLSLWFRFALDNLLFGLFGAFISIIILEWLRHHFEAEAQRERESSTRARQLAAITANSADAILQIGKDGTIQSWNHGAELIFGYSGDEIVGKHFRMLLPEELQAAGEIDYIQSEMEQKGFLRGYVTKRVTKDGRVITVELTRTLLRDEKGRAIGSSTILRDVTERERIQEQTREMNRVLEAQVAERTRELSEANRELRRRQHDLEQANAELRQLDQLKSEFVSLVSHELRAPLANISGVFQLLLEDARDPLGVNQRELLSIADEQVERLARLVKGVLNVSRIEAGEMEFHAQEFDIHEVLEKECNHWTAYDPKHRYVCTAPRQLPPVWADRDRVEEVLTNLVDNAAKYSGEEKPIRVTAQALDGEVVISVRDEGVGISSDDMKRLFERFYRVERDDARQTYGHGLGLYISRKFIEAMGGRLWGESIVGRGSTFHFSLPLARHGEPEKPETPVKV